MSTSPSSTTTDPAAAAATLIEALSGRGLTVATAESCTGGWIGKCLTDVSGSSAVYGCGIISYSNEAKASILGVSEETLAEHGAVSKAVVIEMAEGVRRLASADLAVAVSGVAGPGGGSADKPVGTVWFAWASPKGTDAAASRFSGDRDAVRRQAVANALAGLLERLP